MKFLMLSEKMSNGMTLEQAKAAFHFPNYG